MSPDHYLFVAALLFVIGALGVLLRRNAILVFMSVELMLNSVNLTLVTFSRIRGTLDGHHGLLRDGRRRRRGRHRARDHHEHLPHPSIRVGRRRQPAEVLR